MAKKPGTVTNVSWLVWKTALNLLANHYSKASTKNEVSWEALIGERGEGLDHLGQFQTYDYDDSTFADGLDQAVRELEPEPQQAFILGELRGLTSREAGPLLGVSHATAASRRASATERIRKELVRV